MLPHCIVLGSSPIDTLVLTPIAVTEAPPKVAYTGRALESSTEHAADALETCYPWAATFGIDFPFFRCRRSQVDLDLFNSRNRTG